MRHDQERGIWSSKRLFESDCSFDTPHSRYLMWLTAASLPLVALMPLLLPKGGFWALGVLFLLGTLVAICAVFASSRLAWQLPLLLAGMALLWWGTSLVQGEGSDALPFVAVLLMASVASWVRPLVVPCQSAWWWGVGFTGLVTGGWALWQHGVQGVSRAMVMRPCMRFSTVATGRAMLPGGAGLGNITVTSPVLARLADRRGPGRPVGVPALRQPRRLDLLALCRLASLPLVVVSLAGASPMGSGGMLALSLIALPVLLPQTGVQGRVAAAVAEVKDILAGNARGSIGTRVELYRANLSLIAERPLLGYGLVSYREGMRQQVEQNERSPSVARHWHAHNDLLDGWVKRGLPGLVIVVELYLIPLWAVLRAWPELNFRCNAAV